MMNGLMWRGGKWWHAVAVAVALGGCAAADGGDDGGEIVEGVNPADGSINCPSGGAGACEGGCQVIDAWEVHPSGDGYCQEEATTPVCFHRGEVGCTGQVVAYRHVATGKCLMLVSDCTQQDDEDAWVRDETCPGDISFETPQCE